MENYQTEITPEATPDKPKGKSSNLVSFLVDLLEMVLLAFVLFIIVNAISARVRVYNISMRPTLEDGELLFVNRLAYKLGKPQRGDIIVFHFNEQTGEDYIKRIIGLPGETIRVENGIVYVNDTALTEPYIAAAPAYNGTWVVPDGHIFVLGDNRNNSEDSHRFDAIPLDSVVGKALFIYWPVPKLQVFSRPAYAANAAQ